MIRWQWLKGDTTSLFSGQRLMYKTSSKAWGGLQFSLQNGIKEKDGAPFATMINYSKDDVRDGCVIALMPFYHLVDPYTAYCSAVKSQQHSWDSLEHTTYPLVTHLFRVIRLLGEKGIIAKERSSVDAYFKSPMPRYKASLTARQLLLRILDKYLPNNEELKRNIGAKVGSRKDLLGNISQYYRSIFQFFPEGKRHVINGVNNEIFTPAGRRQSNGRAAKMIWGHFLLPVLTAFNISDHTKTYKSFRELAKILDRSLSNKLVRFHQVDIKPIIGQE